ncbi:NAD-dependent protein deacylase [Clostridium fallax]|uniref:NAD-dependent protein deacetylase n=1 Tax=Clostridium fallax TaxID=1533 RepID=A0A1M4YUT8_9CLOT|nr:NAD-dependent protein deacylase [Clostridium fallax]SHF09106.1 NAD-dependent deacetylase [Clostridium fallax]SQB22188.1 NAD-dependent deacetylase [Clostridium fallax]
MEIQDLKKIIKENNNIVFFGGAGVSTESNIPDFRSANGLYNKKSGIKYSPEEMLSHSFYLSHMEDFYKFYRKNMIYTEAKPNAAHFALSKLEKLGKLKAIITQNIDGLHQLAGSKNVLELHGSIHRNYCTKCGAFYPLEYITSSKTNIPYCEKCGGVVKPDVVLYEEGLNEKVIGSSLKYISEAHILIVGGTSLVVYPAAGMIRYFRGKKLVLINKSKTQYDDMADLVINDSIGTILSECVKDL